MSWEPALREAAPVALGVLVRRHGDFEDAEDALQEALLSASTQWVDAVPDNPVGWLVRVASRRLVDQWRQDAARRRREACTPYDVGAGGEVPDVDDSLRLLFLCCHPSLSMPSQVAVTLRAVGGLTTAEIARAYLVPEATMAQRISRAKATIGKAGATFALPSPEERPARLAAVLKVLYLVFTEGHDATAGPDLARVDLCQEAIRLARMLAVAAPDDGEVLGLLALMLLTDARRPARLDARVGLVPLAEQDRGMWDVALVDEGTALVVDALTSSGLGPYQVQAAIAAVHAEAPDTEHTDWEQIQALYDLLTALSPGPMVTLNRVVCLAETIGDAAALEALESAVRDDATLATAPPDPCRPRTPPRTPRALRRRGRRAQCSSGVEQEPARAGVPPRASTTLCRTCRSASPWNAGLTDTARRRRMSRLEHTRRSLHGVAELLLAGPQHARSGTIRLRVVPGGFATVAEPALRVEGTRLVHGTAAMDLDGRTVADVADESGLVVTSPDAVYYRRLGRPGDRRAPR